MADGRRVVVQLREASCVTSRSAIGITMLSVGAYLREPPWKIVGPGFE